MGNPGGSADVPALPRLFFRADAFCAQRRRRVAQTGGQQRQRGGD
ncbi:hypothetical protein XOC_1314 [Xanthomonas oryzae pv. oryzicola BLS256]|uniref:Uncharacterized protein n=1 Tax=Xanthomonas oryzae pv. oryzicola (strain BLS256) TaxID=383407 RepID=G7THB1_XANOB|nr:hypothetical protein XOC_1314 [Xanthomonas oryzae pv. oryzicola BLS256]